MIGKPVNDSWADWSCKWWEMSHCRCLELVPVWLALFTKMRKIRCVYWNADHKNRLGGTILELLRSVLVILWKDWCWRWNSNTLATSCEEVTHWKRLWCWEGLRAGGEGNDRGWDGSMASLTRWTWVWVNSGSWWWTGRLGVLQFMGSQSRTWLSYWTELNWRLHFI